MDFDARLWTAIVALLLEAAFGYPNALYTRFGHPVTWIGALISTLDNRLNRESMTDFARRADGVLALLIVAGAAAALGYALERWAASSWLGWVVSIAAAASLFASGSLYRHVADVATPLEQGDIEASRKMVGRIVGRDTAQLDAAGVARAAMESLAESASDGVVAPLFWFVCLGLPGLAAYKAINTADSMIGHRTPRHDAFGWAAARFDDLVNWPASRLAGFIYGLAAALRGEDAYGAFRAMARDARHHRSPNAGWPESALAGALGLKLNGPKLYDGAIENDAYMGDGRRDATAADVRRALALSRVGWLILIAALTGLAVILRG